MKLTGALRRALPEWMGQHLWGGNYHSSDFPGTTQVPSEGAVAALIAQELCLNILPMFFVQSLWEY